MSRRAGARSAFRFHGPWLVVLAACAPSSSATRASLEPLADTTQWEIARAREVAQGLRTHEQALRSGFRRIAPEGLTDLNPLQGEHWLRDRALRVRALDLEHPAYVMYYPLGDPPAPRLVGVAYAMLRPTGSEPPSGFHGTVDHWHVHVPCHGIPGIGYALVDSAHECEALGGTASPMQIAMVHVWTEVPNPDGPFGLFNSALPYLATGIDPPTAADLADPARGRFFREVAFALGETYGAVPRMGARIAQLPDSIFADRVRPYRGRIRALLPALRAARGDTTRFRKLGTRAVGEWRHIRDAYLAAAYSPQHRAMLERWFDAAAAGHE